MPLANFVQTVRHCCSYRVEQALPDLIKELLAPHGLQPSDCCYAVHTGGPKILERTAAALGVSADCMQVPCPYADDPENSLTLTAMASQQWPCEVFPMLRWCPKAYNVWAVNFFTEPGIKRICNAVPGAVVLTLRVPPALQASWEVMREQGNLSGASNIAVLDRARRMAASGAGMYAARRHCVCIAMGPGVAMETLLLRRA